MGAFSEFLPEKPRINANVIAGNEKKHGGSGGTQAIVMAS